MPFEPTGNFVARGADRVDAQLVEILKAAADAAGMNVQAYSGYRPGDKRAHGRGIATDIRIIGPDGKALANYQDPTTFSQYEKLAQQARKIQMEKYPDLKDRFRWGGYFGGPKGKYGAMDSMHFDLAGGNGLGMAGGSWEKGLTEQQASMFPGAKSRGMGLMDIFNPEVQAQAMAQKSEPIAQQIASNQTQAAPQAPGTPAPALPSPINVGDRPVATMGSMSPQPQGAVPDSIMAAATAPLQTDKMGAMFSAMMQPQQQQLPQMAPVRGPSPEQANALSSLIAALKQQRIV